VFTAAGGISGLRGGQEEPLGAAFGREQCHLNRVMIRTSLEVCSTGALSILVASICEWNTACR